MSTRFDLQGGGVVTIADDRPDLVALMAKAIDSVPSDSVLEPCSCGRMPVQIQTSWGLASSGCGLKVAYGCPRCQSLAKWMSCYGNAILTWNHLASGNMSESGLSQYPDREPFLRLAGDALTTKTQEGE